MNNINVKIKHRSDTLANWEASNPVLYDGELGYITDKNEFRIGDGQTAFTELQNVFISKKAIEEMIKTAVAQITDA